MLGEEELLVERAVEDIVAEVRAADPHGRAAPVRAAELTPATLAESLSPSLFAEARVIVLQARARGRQGAGRRHRRAGRRPGRGRRAGGAARRRRPGTRRSPTPCASAGAAVTTCNKITRYEERADFVRGEVRRAGGRITPGAVGVLIEAVGSDLRELAAATSQLVADTGGTVDEPAVRRYHRGRAEATGFAVADKVVAGDRAGCAGGAALGRAARGAAGAGRRRAGRRAAHPGQGRLGRAG